MNSIPLRLIVLPHGEDLELPAYQSADAAGFDVRAAIDADNPRTLAPGERTLVPTGISMELPSGYEAQVRPRSGLALKHGLTVLNAPGTIDADYRGEVKVILINHGQEPCTIARGDRVAQIIVQPVVRAQIETVATLNPTERGDGGFGSTGSE